MMAQISPKEGVYTISLVPTMKLPPIHVAAEKRNTFRTNAYIGKQD